MRRTFLCGITSATIALSSAAQADWHTIGSDSAGSEWLMDGDRITVEGGRIHAWVKIDASKNRTSKYREGLRLYSSICSSRKIKLLSIAQYDSYGKVIDSDDFPDTYGDIGYRYVTPESMGETVLKVSCALGSAKSN
jgi:hypothetical protein